MTHPLDYPLARKLAANGIPVARVRYQTKWGTMWTTAYWREDEHKWYRCTGDLGPIDNLIEVDQSSMDHDNDITDWNR